MKQISKITKVGTNTACVVIRKDVMERLGLKIGDYIEIELGKKIKVEKK